MTIENLIRKCIEEQLDKGRARFIIFPFGEIGRQFEDILKNVYNISPEYILDNHLCKYNSGVHALLFLNEIDCSEYVVFLAATNREIYQTLKEDLQEYVPCENIAELDSMKNTKKYGTHIGKYSYGSICHDHRWIESIGSFCSFAVGVEIVENHQVYFLTTHPMLYAGKNFAKPEEDKEYGTYKNETWYFEGVTPVEERLTRNKKSTIGNDVWLGRNVLITNGANIGNGVIAGAGAVITKDVPDYAVVGGVPARIIRYRYTPEQIAALNRIQWWNWSDDEIRERYQDFYLPITEFIQKYDKVFDRH